MPGKHVPAQRSSALLIHLTSSVWTTEVPEDLPAEIPETPAITQVNAHPKEDLYTPIVTPQ